MDAVVFNPLEGASKNHPVATERIGTVGYWSSKAAVAVSEVFGIATMGYFAWAAPLVTGGSIAAGWGTKKALQAGGVNDDAAGFYGGVVGILAADRLSSSKAVPSAEGKLTGFVGRLADKASGLLPGLRTTFEQTAGNEAGFLRTPMTKELTIPGERTSYNPIEPGPLPEDVAGTFRSATYDSVKLKEPITLYRVYSDPAGKIGPYWIPEPPASSLKSVVDNALDQTWGNRATDVVKIQVPAGETIYAGPSASQGGLVGGKTQVYLRRVDPTWEIQ
jgi:hypothetical protein